MRDRSVVVLGGGLAGMAAAYSLAREGARSVTIVEAGHELGGLAGTLERDGYLYPLTYHPILDQHETLLYFLDRVGALPSVRWRKIKLLFEWQGRFYDFAHPGDMLRFPMSLADKVRFVRLMLRSFAKRDWDDWQDRSAAELVDQWGSPGVREAIFERLSRLKFELPCSDVSAAWLGSRLHFREGSSPLGYIPGSNWTTELCRGLTTLLEKSGVEIRTATRARRMHGVNGAVESVELEGGEIVRGDVFVSALPTEVYLEMIDDAATPQLDSIRYTAVLACMCATNERVRPDFYWMSLASLDSTACGIFVLNSLNPEIGAPGESCVNFVTHLPSREEARFHHSDEQVVEGYLADYRRLFGRDLAPTWSQVIRLPRYSPVFDRGYRNPPVRSHTWRNVYFAGNYRSFPSIASTGTALGSGLEAASAILEDAGAPSSVARELAAFRP